MNKYITETITRRRKLREEDQFFMVGRFNVTFNMDETCGKKCRYYLVNIVEFDGIETTARPLDNRFLYIVKENENTYTDVWQMLHNADIVNRLMCNLDNTIIRKGDLA